jgi:predicted CXXCH cytochrome family protein
VKSGRFAIALRLTLAGILLSQCVRAQPARTIFDEIRDPEEGAAFRSVWDARDPAKQRQLAVAFVGHYPRSILLKEAYELAARASVSTGDLAGALEWAKRSLRLMPENPFLLTLVGDTAAKVGQVDLAETSARDALRYLSTASTPSPLSAPEWPKVRSELRASSYFVIGRVAALRGSYSEAEESLLTALTLKPDDPEAAYTLGVVRLARHDDAGAAAALARVLSGGGPLASAAAQSLRAIYGRRPAPGVSFEAFVASLKWTPPPSPAQPAAPQIRGAYAGSQACRECHSVEYQRWQATGMAKMLRPYRPADVIGDFSGRQTVAGSARAEMDGNRHVVAVRKGATGNWIRYPVDFVIGSKWQQAYATRLGDGRVLVFPIQYSKVRSEWVNYWEIVDVRGTPRTDISLFHQAPADAVYQSTCASCHTSQLSFRSAIEPSTAEYREGGVNCEMCHGPSLDHVEQMRGSRTASRSNQLPVDFSRLSAEESVAVCAQCHAQSAVHNTEPAGAANYAESGPFYRRYAMHLPSDFSRSAFYRDGRHRSTTFIVEAFTRSQCFRKGGATCASCHDPHPAKIDDNVVSLKFAADSDEMCVQCHKTIGANAQRHTHHQPGSEASRCVSCHMARTMEALLFKARSHQIDDIPSVDMLERFGNADSPNACIGCHQDRDAAWLRSAMAAFEARSR